MGEVVGGMANIGVKRSSYGFRDEFEKQKALGQAAEVDDKVAEVAKEADLHTRRIMSRVLGGLEGKECQVDYRKWVEGAREARTASHHEPLGVPADPKASQDLFKQLHEVFGEKSFGEAHA